MLGFVTSTQPTKTILDQLVKRKPLATTNEPLTKTTDNEPLTTDKNLRGYYIEKIKI